jgi:uncharacterized membrane protein
MLKTPASEHHHGGDAAAHRDGDLHRFIQLTDGVFAIAITLLAFDLKPPDDWDGLAASLFHAMATPLAAFGLSFMLIAFYWVANRRCFRHIRHTDGVLTGLNFLSLGLITLLPAATRLLMQHARGTEATQVYLGLIVAIGASNALIWGYASMRSDLMDQEVPLRLRVVLFLYLLIIAPLMAGLAMVASTPQGRWAWLVMAAVIVSARLARRWAGQGVKF